MHNREEKKSDQIKIANSTYYSSDIDAGAIYNRLHGALIGQAYGDAFGMPSELWNRQKVHSIFGWIEDFLPGHPENIASNEFCAYQFTDDTSQALAITQVVEREGKTFRSQSVGREILAWAEHIHAFEKNILGPSSKAALAAIKEGRDIGELENKGITNGAAMRICPIGCAFSYSLSAHVAQIRQYSSTTKPFDDSLSHTQASHHLPGDLAEMTDAVYRACAPTHKSYSALTGARLVACAISALINGAERNNVLHMLPTALEYYPLAREADDFTPEYGARIGMMLGYFEHGMRIVQENNPHLVPFSQCEVKKSDPLHARMSQEEWHLITTIYDGFGAGMSTVETVSCAFFLNAVCDFDPRKVAFLAANLGGDTDTIGAIACAIAGAGRGAGAFDQGDVARIEEVNGVDLSDHARMLLNVRMSEEKCA